MNRYRFMTLEKLISTYVDETRRINQEDKKITQKLIKDEIRSRMNRLIRTLEDEASLEYDLKTRTPEEEAKAIMRWVVNPSD